MAVCRYIGCKNKRGVVAGYCRVHHSQANPPTLSPSKNEGLKNEVLCKKLDQMLVRIHHLENENVALTNLVSEHKDVMDVLSKENAELKLENGDLKQKINLNFLANDCINNLFDSI